MKQMAQDSKIAATARALGISEEQVREVLKAEGGTWTTKTNSIVTHADGTRHWSNATCEACRS